jgi:CubicO group peptidase (beta-lactamase class C family)
MRKALGAIALSCVLVGGPTIAAGSLAPQLAATPTPLPPQIAEAFVDGVVRDAMRADHVAGATVAVVQNGKVLMAKGYGAASLAPWRPASADTPFRIGSTSKTFTWIALMQEVEQGRVQLDAPVNAYLPPEARFPDNGFKRPIRVRDLMSHTAGLEDLALGHLVPRDLRHPLPLARYIAEEQPRRVREPGVAVSYCNYCAVLAGYIVAQQEGGDFPTTIERRITGPLGMTATTFREVGPPRPGMPAPMSPLLAASMSEGFSWQGDHFQARPPEAVGQIAPAGGAASTATDMARYMLALLNDGSLGSVRVFGPEAASAFRTPILATPPGINGWDHGFMQTVLPGGFAAYGHTGDTTIFHAQMVTVPALNLGVFVAANTDTGYKLAARLPELLVQHFYANTDAEASAPARLDVKALAPYAGTYLPIRRTSRGVEGFVDLLQVTTVAASAQGLVTDGATLWVPDGAPGRFRQRDGVRVLSFDIENGRPVRWRTTNNVSQNERAKWWERPEPLLAAAGLTLAASVATLAGLFIRSRNAPRSRSQAAGGLLQTAASIAWITAFVGLAGWAANAGDSYGLVFGWPGPLITTATWAAAAAAILSVIGLALLAPIWRSEGWSGWRKVRYGATATVYCALAALLLVRGGLAVWSL